VRAYTGLAGLFLLGGLAFGRPELTVLAIPFLLAVLVGVAMTAPRSIRVSMVLARSRVLEGDEVVLEVSLRTPHPDPPPQGGRENLPQRGRRKVEVTLQLEPGVALAGDPIHRVDPPPRPSHTRGEGESAASREGQTARITIRCLRWGLYDVGRLRLRWRDPLWLFTQEGSVDLPMTLRVYPRPEVLRALTRPSETQVFAGNQLARVRGDGIEFAEIRPFHPGDRVRHINWHATGRRGALQVNDLHPERNSDVILFLDTFGTYGEPADRTLDRMLRAAIGLADLYLRHRDRVGVIAFGGMLRWLTPGIGVRQRYLLVEAVLDTRLQVSYAWKTIDTIPSRTLPPKALIIALTPLIDERITSALDQLSGRGFDLAICEVTVSPTVAASDPIAKLAARVFALRRDTLRGRYHRAGVAASAWPAGQPLEQTLEEVRVFRRHARRRSA
jgi:uncharacterized protein (DUF58 family)